MQFLDIKDLKNNRNNSVENKVYSKPVEMNKLIYLYIIQWILVGLSTRLDAQTVIDSVPASLPRTRIQMISTTPLPTNSEIEKTEPIIPESPRHKGSIIEHALKIFGNIVAIACELAKGMLYYP